MFPTEAVDFKIPGNDMQSMPFWIPKKEEMKKGEGRNAERRGERRTEAEASLLRRMECEVRSNGYIVLHHLYTTSPSPHQGFCTRQV